MALRLQRICLALAGYPVEAIADIAFSHPRTVQRWLTRSDAEGLPGLPDRPRSGRPRFGAPRLGLRVAACLAQPKAWTVPRLRRRPCPTLSLSMVRRRIREVARWRRTRLIAQGDPEAPQRWAPVRRALTQLPATAVILAEEECHLDLLAWLRSTWSVRGQRQRVWTPGQNQRRTLFGALDVRTGAWWEQVTRKANSQEFIAFLEQLLAGHRRAPVIVLVLDNVIIHSSQAVEAWLAEHPRILLLYGARYSPHANPVERVWGVLKRDLANTAPLTMPGSLQQEVRFFGRLTAADLLRIAVPAPAPWIPRTLRQDLRRAA